MRFLSLPARELGEERLEPTQGSWAMTSLPVPSPLPPHPDFPGKKKRPLAVNKVHFLLPLPPPPPPLCTKTRVAGVRSGEGQSSLVTCFKGAEGKDGKSAGTGCPAICFRRFRRNRPILVPSPSPLSGSVSRVAAGPTGRGGQGGCPPSAWVAAVFGLTTGLHHARVHVVIQSGKNFPACLEKPETLNGFQGLLMWPAQEIAIRQ